MAAPTDRLQGTLDLLILRILAQEELHGWAISKRIRETSQGVLEVNQGSLYPALYRMAKKGWIKGEWGITENKRRAKYYRLTEEGRRQFSQQSSGWARLAGAVNAAVGTVQPPHWAR